MDFLMKEIINKKILIKIKIFSRLKVVRFFLQKIIRDDLRNVKFCGKNKKVSREKIKIISAKNKRF